MTEWYRNTWSDIVKKLNSDSMKGLTSKQAEERMVEQRQGKSVKTKSIGVFSLVLYHIKKLWILILIFSWGLSFYLEQYVVAGLTFAIIGITISLLVRKDFLDQKEVKELEKVNYSFAKVIRDNKFLRITSDELVRGDIVFLEKGNVVPADLRIIESDALKIKETAVTGEEFIVEKYATKIEERELSLTEMKNIAFKASFVTSGSGMGIVIATGEETQIGKIIKILLEEKKNKASIEEKLQPLLNKYSKYVLYFAFIILGIEVFINRDSKQGLSFVNFVFIAGIPEGIIIIIAILSVLVAKKMQKEKIDFKNLSITQLLSGVNVICSEKIGAISETNMILSIIHVNGNFIAVDNGNFEVDENIERVMQIGILCNDFKLNSSQTIISGDLLDIGLVRFGLLHGFNKTQLEREQKRVLQIPYDSERRLMTTINRTENKYRANCKGSVDSLLSRCTHIMRNGIEKLISNEDIEEIKRADIEMSNNSLVVIGTAYRSFSYEPSLDENIESNLVFAGIIGFANPVKEEAQEAIRYCKREGIKPIIFTEDNKLAAFALGEKLGIVYKNEQVLSGVEMDNMKEDELKRNIAKVSVFSKITPEHKNKIARILKEYGCTVVMTGTHLTDLPYLKAADIGISVSEKSNSTVKKLADIFLQDNNFYTLLNLVEESRRIINSMKQIVLSIFICNSSELVLVFLATLLGKGRPLLLTELFWQNIVVGTVCAIAVLIEYKNNETKAHEPIMIDKNILKGRNGRRVLFQGIFIGIFTFIAFYFGGNVNNEFAQMSAFTTLGLCQGVNTFIFTNSKKKVFENKLSNVILFSFLIIQCSLFFAFEWTVLSGFKIKDFFILALLLTLVLAEIIIVIFTQKRTKASSKKL